MNLVEYGIGLFKRKLEKMMDYVFLDVGLFVEMGIEVLGNTYLAWDIIIQASIMGILSCRR